jgi:heme exporter protein B
VRGFLAILGRDLALEARRRESLLSMGVFAAATLVVFSLAFDPTVIQAKASGPGIVWVTILFAATIGLSRTFATESAGEVLAGLLLAPVDRTAIYLAKVVSTFVLVGIVEAAAFLGFVVLFDPKELEDPLVLFGITLLATAGFLGSGVLFAAMTRHARGGGGTLLQILLLPLSIPIFLGGVQTTERLLRGLPLGDAGKWIPALAAFAAVYLALGSVLFEKVVEE